MAHALESCIVVGAGISGLLAAARLQNQGLRVLVLDKGADVGGRMATRRMEEGCCDHGAQFFTTRDPAFAEEVAAWVQKGVAQEWCRGFPGADGKEQTDGHPRYCGTGGMRSVPKHLAAGLDVRCGGRVVSAAIQEGHWSVRIEEGSVYEADALLLTPPVPQSLALLDVGNAALEPEDRRALEAVSYDPCIAALALMSGPTTLPPPGALQVPTNCIDWIADNQQKGISPGVCCVTIHANAEFSRAHAETSHTEIADLLLHSAGAYLPHPARTVQIHRWRYAKPDNLHPADHLLATGLAPLAFAGDAFGTPRVEGAALSGWAAAQALLRT